MENNSTSSNNTSSFSYSDIFSHLRDTCSSSSSSMMWLCVWLWPSLLLLAGSLSFIAGSLFVTSLRSQCRTTTLSRRLKRLTALIFLAPISLFLLLHLAVLFCGLHRTLADSISFGIVTGIISKLATKPTGEGSVKLVAQQVVAAAEGEGNGKHVDVWLDSVELTVGEVRTKIAEALGVLPVQRVSIESGKGAYIEDLSKAFYPLIDDASKTTDFFGFITLMCFISVKEEDRQKKVTIVEDGDEDHNKDKRHNPFRAILKKPEIKFGDPFSFLAKIAAAPVDSKTSFNISCVDKFAAAAPMTLQILNTSSVRLVSWEALITETNAADAISDAGDISVSSGNKSPKVTLRKKKADQTSKHGKPVCNGDTVVLECGGKYMSVTRGWWMAWTSVDPRRSGAFTIEIVEKAQNKLKEQLKEINEKFKEKIVRPGQVLVGNTSNTVSATLTKDVDNVLRPGDLFRLRSVKFPDFELGLTSIKLRDEYCYLGLRKIDGVEGSTEDESWCMEMLFTMKSANDIFTKV